MLSPRDLLDRRFYLPWARIPDGEPVELPGRGSTFVTDTPGPRPGSPTVILLHALACTGLLTWFPAIEPLSRRYRVITLDQRWHGRGIRSEEFSLVDCADDVAALARARDVDEAIVVGYSMGSVVAQRVWRQHPGLVGGLVLGASTDRFQKAPYERMFFTGVAASMGGMRTVARSRTASAAARAAAVALAGEPTDVQDWALRELRSTSPWAAGQALAALGRHHSRPWLGSVDVPTAVVAMMRDRVIPTPRQLALARAIPGATLHQVDSGHAGVVLESEKFVPVLLEAVATVNARRRDLWATRRRPT